MILSDITIISYINKTGHHVGLTDYLDIIMQYYEVVMTMTFINLRGGSLRYHFHRHLLKYFTMSLLSMNNMIQPNLPVVIAILYQ